MAKLYFNFGAMNSGKSADLIRAAHNYSERGNNILIFGSAIDTRSEPDRLSCRIPGYTSPTIVPILSTQTKQDLLGKVKHYHELRPLSAVFVDEAHFLTTQQIEAFSEVTLLLHLPVLCYGLKTTFAGVLFEGSKRLLELADEFREIKSVCWCGKAARFNARVVDGKVAREGEEVVVGGNETYTGLCRQHYFEGKVREGMDV